MAEFRTGQKPGVGAVVRLKSGGPLMTVMAEPRDDDNISVGWFDGGEMRRDAFTPAELVIESGQIIE